MDCLTVCHLKYDSVRSGWRITPILNPQKRVPHDSNGVMMHALQSQSQTWSCTIFETWTFVRNKHTTNMSNTSKYQTLSLNILHEYHMWDNISHSSWLSCLLTRLPKELPRTSAKTIQLQKLQLPNTFKGVIPRTPAGWCDHMWSLSFVFGWRRSLFTLTFRSYYAWEPTK